MRFRRNIEREIMAYELSKELHYKSVEIQTP
jgi:uracil phosphoribosyltransferase